MRPTAGERLDTSRFWFWLPKHHWKGSYCFHLEQPKACRHIQVSFVVHEKNNSFSLIDSGDDHDYCEITHSPTMYAVPKPIREISVKSFSMAMGIRRPGFQLLSLAPAQYWSDDNVTYADVACVLPDQLNIYLSVYVPFTGLSLLVIIIANTFRTPSHRLSRRRSSSAGFAKRWKLKRPSGDPVDDNDSLSLLPSPVSVPLRSTQLPGPGRAADYTQMSIARRFTAVMHLILPCLGIGRQRRDRTLLYGITRDVRDVAIVPLLLMAFISFWV